MKKTIVVITAVMIAAIFSAPAQAGKVSDQYYEYKYEYYQFKSDISLLKGAADEARGFQSTYATEITLSREMGDLYPKDNIFDKLRAGLRGVELVNSKKGRRMIKEALQMYRKYNPPVKRMLDHIGDNDTEGQISAEQMHRIAKAGGSFEMYQEWKKHPIRCIFNPFRLSIAYRSGFQETTDALHTYRKVTDFMEGDHPAGRLIRHLARLEEEGKIDIEDLDTDLDWDDLREVNLRELFGHPDIRFDPNEYFNQIENNTPPSDSIYFDRRDDF